MAEQLAPCEKIALRDIGAKATVFIGAGNLMAVTGVNGLAAISFIQLFDALIANVTIGTTVPDWEFPVPASVGASLQLASQGVKFRTGCVVAVTTAEKGAAAVAAGFQGFFLVQQ